MSKNNTFESIAVDALPAITGARGLFGPKVSAEEWQKARINAGTPQGRQQYFDLLKQINQ